MSDPVIAARRPTVVELEPGTYWWCRCGRSANQPYCDGSHSGTGFTPVEVNLEEGKRVAWCNCKQTGNRPWCDGTHSKLAED